MSCSVLGMMRLASRDLKYMLKNHAGAGWSPGLAGLFASFTRHDRNPIYTILNLPPVRSMYLLAVCLTVTGQVQASGQEGWPGGRLTRAGAFTVHVYTIPTHQRLIVIGLRGSFPSPPPPCVTDSNLCRALTLFRSDTTGSE